MIKIIIKIMGLLGFLWVTVSLPATAASTANSREISIGLHLENFDYTELDTDNSVLNNESGNLPGLSLSIEQHKNNQVLGAKFTLLNGSVTYDGQTQSGIPVTSVSDTLVMDTEAYIGAAQRWRRNGQEKYRSFVYVGLGYHYWRRDIRPSVIPATGQPVSGLLEHYQWWYGLLGYKWMYKASSGFDWGVDIQARRMLDGTMKVVSSSFDNVTVNLGERWGSRFSLLLRYNLDKRSSVLFEPYLTYWDIGRSNVVAETVNGVPTGRGLVEPRSETRDQGLAVYYRQAF